MAVCSECGALFFVGGQKHGARKFCSDRCAEKGVALLVVDQIPKPAINNLARQFFDAECPVCHRTNRGVDIRRDHRLISAIVVQHFSDRQYVCCRSCGARRQLGMLGATLALGWWSPRGIFMTPVWVGKNAFELIKTARNRPSAEISDLLAREAAEDILARVQTSANC